MPLLQLTLNNFCQHRQRVIRFNPRLTALVGPNGSGKSNILGGISWLLTGEHPNAGKKEDNICQVAPATEPANGELIFTQHNLQYTVQRHLRPDSRSTLEIRDATGHVLERLRGDVGVNQRIAEVLAPGNTLKRYVLVGQGSMFDFLEEKPSIRAESFQRLFRTERAEVLAKFVAANMNRVQIPHAPISREAVVARIADNAARLLVLQQELATASNPTDYETAQAVDRQIVADCVLRANLLGQIAVVQGGLTRLHGQLGQLATEIEQLRDDITALRAATQESAPHTALAQEALGRWAQYRRCEDTRTALSRRRQELLAAGASRPRPQPPTEYIQPRERETVQRYRDECYRQLENDKRFVREFEADGVCECHECHTPVGSIQPQIAAAKARIPERQAEYVALQSRLLAASDYSRQYADWETWYTNHQQLMQQLEFSEQQLAAGLLPPEQDEVSLRAVVAEHAAFGAALAEFETLYQPKLVLQAGLTGQQQQLAGQLTQLQAQTAGLAGTPEDAQAARLRLQQRTEQYAQHTELSRRVAELTAVLRTDRDLVDFIDTTEREARYLRRWLGFARELQTVFHYDGLPKVVSVRSLTRMQSEVNRLLALFEADYRVTADDSLSFMATFMDGRRQLAPRLSWGQQGVLALSFFIAVNSIFAGSVGILALDEPTAYMDEHHISRFAPVLARFRELTAARGLQCLLITHESGLSHLFDEVVTL